MIAFDGMGVYNENVQQYIVNNGYAINKCSTSGYIGKSRICTKHTADRGTGRCNNRAKQAGRRHCTDRLYFGQLF